MAYDFAARSSIESTGIPLSRGQGAREADAGSESEKHVSAKRRAY
jgi:hypothetical protein